MKTGIYCAKCNKELGTDPYNALWGFKGKDYCYSCFYKLTHPPIKSFEEAEKRIKALEKLVINIAKRLEKKSWLKCLIDKNKRFWREGW